MPRPLLLLAFVLASCGEPAKVANRSAEAEQAAGQDVLTAAARPVRVGELGPNFRACGAAGTTRNLRPGEPLAVRAAPFDNSAQTGSVAGGARFFVCTRSHDQKWFGIVFDEAGALADRCGVAEPVTRRQDYAGPCRSGWVQSAFVKLVAGDPASAEPAPSDGDAELRSPPAGA